VTQFLKNREDSFYTNFMDKLQTKNFFKDEVISLKGRKEEYVYFIVGGIVENYSTGRYYEAGHMLNHDCVFEQVPQKHNFRGFAEVTFTFMYSSEVYLEILESYPEIKQEITEMIYDREKSIKFQ